MIEEKAQARLILKPAEISFTYDDVEGTAIALFMAGTGYSLPEVGEHILFIQSLSPKSVDAFRVVSRTFTYVIEECLQMIEIKCEPVIIDRPMGES